MEMKQEMTTAQRIKLHQRYLQRLRYLTKVASFEAAEGMIAAFTALWAYLFTRTDADVQNLALYRDIISMGIAPTIWSMAWWFMSGMMVYALINEGAWGRRFAQSAGCIAWTATAILLHFSPIFTSWEGISLILAVSGLGVSARLWLVPPQVHRVLAAAAADAALSIRARKNGEEPA